MHQLKESEWKAYRERKLPEMTCVCQCGGEWASQAKYIVNNGRLPDGWGETPLHLLVTEKPCPNCGENTLAMKVERN